MAEISTEFNIEVVQNQDGQQTDTVKTEVEVAVKKEQQECVVCTTRCRDCYDIHTHKTVVSCVTLSIFLNKYTQVELPDTPTSPRVLCKGCFDLINVLEHAEIEYRKLKDTFDSILSKNPLFESSLTLPVKLSTVKSEFFNDDNGGDDDDEDFVCDNFDDDSDDEPLATQSKRKRQKEKKKKKVTNTGKRRGRKKNISESWACNECGMTDTVGGADALVEHKLTVHSIDNSEVIHVVKTEDTEGSETLFSNSYDHCLKVELDNMDDNSLTADDIEPKTVKKKLGVGRPRKTIVIPPRKKKAKVIHQCDQCDAKYTSLGRLEQHKQKHDGSKPPYICEVCGAHYKHKRACDIHIALHRGISDWKCEECNKLFPSKNALQRHNNIHTGKLNYQCDLCGKSFIHTSSFKMHKLSHSGVKPHSCDVCGLALMTRSHLKRHKRVHSGEKRHECTVCGKRFSERYNLVAHSKAHEPLQPLQPLHAPQPAPPRRRLFRCPYCAERFERRYMLERHSQAAHGCALERPPPTPRNTMSKLLKAQAQRRHPAPAGTCRPDPTSPDATRHSQRRHPAPADADTKEDVSSESTARPITAQKLIAQLYLQHDGFERQPPSFRSIVAEMRGGGQVAVGSTVVGYALFYPTYSTRVGRTMMLQDFYVRANHRQRGVGGMLFDAVAKEASLSGCSCLDLHVLEWNPASSFYEARGAVNLTKKEQWCYYRLSEDALHKLA